MVTWGICDIYKGFLVWIIPSTYQSNESKVWACTTSFVHTCIYWFTWCFRLCFCVPMLTTQFSTYAFQFDLSIHMCLLVHATWPHFTYSLGSFLTTLDLHVQISELRVCGFSLLLIRVAQRKRGLLVNRSELFLPAPPTRLQSFLVIAREILLYCSYLYIPL